MRKASLSIAPLVLGAVAACAGGGSESSAPTKGGGYGGYAYGAGGSNGGIGGGAGPINLNLDAAAAADAPPLPPEDEQNVSFLAPRAGARYVYVANPTRNTVSIIDSATLAVVEVAPGDSPTYVATVPGQDIALVINASSHTLRILRGTSMNAKPISVVAKANAIAISPDGSHAVIWYDPAQVPAGTSSAGTSTSSAQEVSVVNLASTTDNVFAMSVGYNPSAVVFANDNTAAFVVADNGISELRFANITGPAIAPFTPFNSTSVSLVRRDAGAPDAQPAAIPATPDAAPASLPGTGGAAGAEGGTAAVDGGAGIDGVGSSEAGPSPGDAGDTKADLRPPPDVGPSDLGDQRDTATTSPPATTSSSNAKVVDVSVTPNGSYAIARREGTAELLLIDLATDVITSLTLSSPVTDLDLLPSGNEAFAVLRQENTLVRIEIPAGFADPSRRTPWPLDVTIGSVTMSAQGKYAVLYSTATASTNLVVLDLTRDSYRVVDVKRAVRAVAVAPNEKTALVLHPLPSTSGTGGTTTASSTKVYGYTMVRLEDGFPKWQDTLADPNPFAITPDSTDVFVLLRDDKAGVRIAQRMSLESFTTTDFPLGSPPSSIAALSKETHKVFVGQVHPEGRISFIDWVTGSVESVTGFALSGRIQQ
jgi:YVTN family beta-propeller protein